MDPLVICPQGAPSPSQSPRKYTSLWTKDSETFLFLKSPSQSSLLRFVIIYLSCLSNCWNRKPSLDWPSLVLSSSPVILVPRPPLSSLLPSLLLFLSNKRWSRFKRRPPSVSALSLETEYIAYCSFFGCSDSVCSNYGSPLPHLDTSFVWLFPINSLLLLMRD